MRVFFPFQVQHHRSALLETTRGSAQHRTPFGQKSRAGRGAARPPGAAGVGVHAPPSRSHRQACVGAAPGPPGRVPRCSAPPGGPAGSPPGAGPARGLRGRTGGAVGVPRSGFRGRGSAARSPPPPVRGSHAHGGEQRGPRLHGSRGVDAPPAPGTDSFSR